MPNHPYRLKLFELSALEVDEHPSLLKGFLLWTSLSELSLFRLLSGGHWAKIPVPVPVQTRAEFWRGVLCEFQVRKCQKDCCDICQSEIKNHPSYPRRWFPVKDRHRGIQN